MAHGERGDGARERFAAAAARVRAAVKAGDITEAQGRERLAAFRKSLGEKTHGEREGEHKREGGREKEGYK